MSTVVLLSGGLDSGVALAIYAAHGGVDALTIDYGQRHRREIDSARAIAAHYNVSHTVASVDPVLFGGSALTDGADIPKGHADEPDATYVPARNTVLIALAAARAESIGAKRIVIGANADDAGGYPDCRPAYIQAYRDVLQQGTLGHVWVAAPLLAFTKAQVVELAADLHVPTHLTWSCYRGGEQPCGECGACAGLAETERSLA